MRQNDFAHEDRGLRPVRVQRVPAPTYVVRTAADPASLVARIRAEAAAMDPDVPIAELSTLASYVSNAMSQTRFLLALIGAFAALALGVASLGLCGVISYSARKWQVTARRNRAPTKGLLGNW